MECLAKIPTKKEPQYGSKGRNAKLSVAPSVAGLPLLFTFIHTINEPKLPHRSIDSNPSDRNQSKPKSRTMPSDNAGYDPRRSRVSDNTMMDFIRGRITGELTEVPGIGPKTAEKLAEGGDDGEGVTNTYQLVGKFLMLKGPDTEDNKVECLEHCEKFWYWLQSKGVSSHRSAIVKAIAQKMNGVFPGVYDDSLYEEDEDEE